jgi:hypothetical protein
LEIELPDGTVLEAPDDADIKKVVQGYKRQVGTASAKLAVQQSRMSRNGATPAEYSPANVPMMENLAAGAGKFLLDMYQGGQQRLGMVGEDETAETRRLDAPLMASGAGKTGYIGGGAAFTGPLLAIPGVNTVAGAGALGAITGGLQPTVEGESALMNAGLGLALGAGGQKLGSVIADKAGKAIAGRIAARAAPKTEAQQKVERAIAEGFKLTPQQMGRGGAARAASSLSGRPQLEREFSMSNSKLVNALAQEEIGLPRSPTLNRAGIAQKKAQANSVYDKLSKLPDGQFDQTYQYQVAAIGNKSGGNTFQGSDPDIEGLKAYFANIKNFRSADVVQKVRQLRSDGYKNLSKIRNPAENAKGQAQLDIAKAMDDALERHASAVGKPDLVKEYKAARVQLAKIHTLEDSIEGSDVSAKQIFNNIGDNPAIKGNFRKIAEAYESFDRSFQDVAKIRDHGPFSVVDGLVAGASSLGSILNPAMLFGVAARPLTRSALGSSVLQRAMAVPPGQGIGALSLARAGSPLPQAAGVVLPSYLDEQNPFQGGF